MVSVRDPGSTEELAFEKAVRSKNKTGELARLTGCCNLCKSSPRRFALPMSLIEPFGTVAGFPAVQPAE
jgi:hypothetical protein